MTADYFGVSECPTSAGDLLDAAFPDAENQAENSQVQKGRCRTDHRQPRRLNTFLTPLGCSLERPLYGSLQESRRTSWPCSFPFLRTVCECVGTRAPGQPRLSGVWDK